MQRGAVAVDGYFDPTDECVEELVSLIGVRTDPDSVPHADAIEREVVIYAASTIERACDDPTRGRALMAEIASVLRDGSGVIAVRGAIDRRVLDRTTDAFWRLLAEQQRGRLDTGDHFGVPGGNDRVWNALEKLAVADPEAFVDYYASATIALVSEAWLGPAYQVTSQLNVVNPGGVAQSAHRDYHLGFMSDESAAVFPAHVHALSPLLTLQGAVAHCDMPVASGPTKLLPHSHKFAPGYVVWKQPAIVELFERTHLQLELAAGDAMFFNPAVYHAAGDNRTTDVKRIANLLLVGRGFGGSREPVPRDRVVRAVYPALLDRLTAGCSRAAVDRALAAAAEGYAFPTNLDRNPPIGGLAPPSQADVVRRALDERWSPAQLDAHLATWSERRLTH
jgi:ectoine hydroxylase-related dioxygenase (phytanoyl-CoA dioxygenase family)